MNWVALSGEAINPAPFHFVDLLCHLAVLMGNALAHGFPGIRGALDAFILWFPTGGANFDKLGKVTFKEIFPFKKYFNITGLAPATGIKSKVAVLVHFLWNWLFLVTKNPWLFGITLKKLWKLMKEDLNLLL